MKTKAAVLRQMELPRPYAESRPLSIEEVELDGPGENEVLVQVAGAGLCHSDLSVINGSRPRPVPMVMGHEAAGIVRDVGSGVKGLKPDDHVVFSFVPCVWRLPDVRGRPGAVVRTGLRGGHHRRCCTAAGASPWATGRR